MADKTEEAMKKHEEGLKYMQDHMKYWRSWGSWFSWGSPVGLGLFFVEACAAVWLLAQAFGWGS